MAIGFRNIDNCNEESEKMGENLKEKSENLIKEAYILCLTLELTLKWIIQLDNYNFSPDFVKFGGILRTHREPKIGYGDGVNYSVLSLEKGEGLRLQEVVDIGGLLGDNCAVRGCVFWRVARGLI